ncbi:hypothetical protein HanPSC8_Chr09g0357491 [Helianthus annuus]|nr:hypothetical protein HanIR_Chr09g0400321 [Helianthus annuus]KAJ0891727.1 hypothetical protein HanPSC8_Chr09g0357491 [Helianthus annuus]
MCEICGGPHFTIKCSQYEGSSTPYYANPFVQPQQYSLQGYPTNAKEMFPNFFELRELILECVRATKELEYGDPRLPRMIDLLDRMFEQIGPNIECDLSRQRDPRCEECGGSHRFEDCAIAARFEMGWRSREQKQPIQWGYDDDDEWVTVQSSYYKAIVLPELAEGETIWGYVESKAEKVEVEREEEEEVEVEQPSNEDQISWENEFRDELDGLPVDEEVKELDPEGDLAYLEVLLEGSPMTDIKEEEVVVEEEEHHSWPMVLVIHETSKSTKPRENARKGKNRDWKRVGSWYKTEKKEPLKFKHDRSSHYMPHIRFLPGMFKFWWSDPFQIFKILYNSTNLCLKIFEVRVELNGLDRVQVKEKPPD